MRHTHYVKGEGLGNQDTPVREKVAELLTLKVGFGGASFTPALERYPVSKCQPNEEQIALST